MKPTNKLRVVVEQPLPKPKQPSSLLDPNYKYYNASNTDVQRTWRRFGWTPLGNREIK
jgi:hypothetical protein